MVVRERRSGLVYLLALGLVITTLILAFSSRETRIYTGSQEGNVLTVSGTGEVTAEPDEAYMYLRVETLKSSADQAQFTNSRVSSNVIDELKSQGLKDSDIETYRFTIYRKESYNENSRRMEFEGYQVEHVIKATTARVKEVGDIIDAAVQSGADGVERVSFGLSKKKEADVKGEALARAAALSREKALALSASTGVRLGKIRSVSESGSYYAPYDYYPGMRIASAEKFNAADSASIQPQKLELSATVTIVYELN